MGSRKREIRGLLFVSFFLFFSFLISHLPPVNAADPKDELEKIQKRLLREKLKVKKTIEQERSILSELERINKTLGKKREELKGLDKRLTRTRSKIGRLNNEIVVLDGKLDTRKSFLKGRLRNIYKQQYKNIANILVSARDNKELIKRIKYISFIADYDRKMMTAYNSEIKELNVKIGHMKILQKELEVDKNKVRRKTKDLQKERKKKDHLLSSVKGEHSSYEKMVRELEDSSKNLREMIKKLEREKLSSALVGKGFKNLRGRLPWPVNGEVLVPFGKQKDNEFNIPTFKKGIEIESKTGNLVLAVSGGRVVFADWFKGYGLLLIVNHGSGYHTLYANLSEIFHKTGDIIKRRQAVGKVGESGMLNVPSLYFEVRYKGRPVDPLKWLRIRKKT